MPVTIADQMREKLTLKFLKCTSKFFLQSFQYQAREGPWWRRAWAPQKSWLKNRLLSPTRYWWVVGFNYNMIKETNVFGKTNHACCLTPVVPEVGNLCSRVWLTLIIVNIIYSIIIAKTITNIIIIKQKSSSLSLSLSYMTVARKNPQLATCRPATMLNIIMIMMAMMMSMIVKMIMMILMMIMLIADHDSDDELRNKVINLWKYKNSEVKRKLDQFLTYPRKLHQLSKRKSQRWSC